MKLQPTTTRINALLKKAGYCFRLVRGRGYYYLTGDEVAAGFYSSSISTYRLDATEADFQFARIEVNAILAGAGLKTI